MPPPALLEPKVSAVSVHGCVGVECGALFIIFIFCACASRYALYTPRAPRPGRGAITGGGRVDARKGAVGLYGFRADLTLARRGPTLATLVRPQSEDLFVEGKTFLRDAACGRTLADLTLARSRL